MTKHLAKLIVAVVFAAFLSFMVLFVAPTEKPLGPSTANGAEPKDVVGRPTHFLVEYGPTREEDPYSYWTERVVAPGQAEPTYRVCLQLTRPIDINQTEKRILKVSEFQAGALVKLHDFVKDKQKPPSDALTRARVVWEANGWQYQFTLEGSGEWRLDGEKGTAISIKTISELLKDIEALKAVKPSIKW